MYRTVSITEALISKERISRIEKAAKDCERLLGQLSSGGDRTGEAAKFLHSTHEGCDNLLDSVEFLYDHGIVSRKDFVRFDLKVSVVGNKVLQFLVPVVVE